MYLHMHMHALTTTQFLLFKYFNWVYFYNSLQNWRNGSNKTEDMKLNKLNQIGGPKLCFVVSTLCQLFKRDPLHFFLFFTRNFINNRRNYKEVGPAVYKMTYRTKNPKLPRNSSNSSFLIFLNTKKNGIFF